MQLGGESREVELSVDLTKYDSRCVVGEKGKTIPNFNVGMWGRFDHFVAVRFENGAVMDVLYDSLKFADKAK